MINSISAQNFKGWTGSHELSKVTLFCGPNFKHKSARVQGLVALLAGSLPSSPGKLMASRELFDMYGSGNPVKLSGADDTGRIYNREWLELGGSVKYSGTKESLVPPVAVDAQAFFGLSGPEQVKFLFARTKLPPEMTVVQLTNTITANIKNIKLDDGSNTEETEAVINTLAASVHAGLISATASVQDWLTSLVAGFKEKLATATQNVKRMQQTSQGLTQVASGEVPPADAEQRLSVARQVFDEANAELARLRQVGEQAKEAHAAASLKAQGAVDETEARAELERLSQEKKRLFEVTAAGRPSDKTEQDANKLATKNHDDIQRQCQQADQTVERLTLELEHAQSETTCPMCKQSTVEIKKVLVSDLKKSIKAATDEAKKLGKQFAAAKTAYQATIKPLESVAKLISDFDRDTTWFRTVSQQHLDLQRKLEGTAAATEAKAQLPTFEEKLVSARTDYATQSLAVKAKRDAVAAGDLQYKRLLAIRAEASQRAKTEAEALRARAEQSVLKLAFEMLMQLQQKLIDAAIGPFVKLCNELCHDILVAPLQWYRYEGRYKDGEIGMTNPDTGRFVPWTSFSDAERLLTYAAVSMALASENPLRIVCLDRLEHADDANKAKLLANLLRLIHERKLDQAVLVEVGDAKWIGNGGETVSVLRL